MASIPFLVIPAAGKGTRMKLVDPGLPKELLPIGGKPAIQYTIEEGMDAGIERIIVIISKEKECIRDRLVPLSYPVTYLYQQELKGEADAIALAEPIVGNRPLAIMYPDNLYLPAPGVLRTLTAVLHRRSALSIGPSAGQRR